MPVNVYYDESPAGSGKTERAIKGITRTQCKVLFVTERKESFYELHNRITSNSRKMGTCPKIIHIHGDTNNRGGSVTKEVEELPFRFADFGHIIVIVTHAALLRSDFRGFTGWRIVIDEVPAFLDFEEKTTHLDAAYFQCHYSLESVGSGWSIVTPTTHGSSLSCADVRADDSHAHLAVFHARVMEASKAGSSRHVLCNLSNWGAMQTRKVKWCWASIFSLRELAAFERVELLGSRFRRNIGCLLTQFFDGDDGEWVPLDCLNRSRQFVSRSVHIHFFSNRPSAKSYFGSDEGQEILQHIGQFLREELPPEKSIWSANEAGEWRCPSAKELLDLPTSDFLTPKQAGTNLFKDFSFSKSALAEIRTDLGDCVFKECERLKKAYIVLSGDGTLITVARSYRKAVH